MVLVNSHHLAGKERILGREGREWAVLKVGRRFGSLGSRGEFSIMWRFDSVEISQPGEQVSPVYRILQDDNSF